METVYLIILICANLLVSNLLAYLCTTGKRAIKVKPLNCRECMTFWLTFAIGGLLACNYDGEKKTLLTIIAVLSAFLNYYYVKSNIFIIK